MKKSLFLILLSIFSSANKLYCTDSTAVHQLYLYAVPSSGSLDWSSPAHLLESTMNSFIGSLFKKDAFTLGHLFIVAETPLCDSVVRMGMTSTNNFKKIEQYLKNKIGLGILLVPLEGKLESNLKIKERNNFYRDKGRDISFIRYMLNEISMKRVLEFLRIFSGQADPDYQPHKIYGGEFWPRYRGEGAGCSAMSMATIDVAGISIDYPEWYASINIPMELLGGTFNNGKRVSTAKIEASRRWHNGKGVPYKDFYPFKICDPSKVYNWIQTAYYQPVQGFSTITIDGIKGLAFDARSIIPNIDEPIIINREQ